MSETMTITNEKAKEVAMQVEVMANEMVEYKVTSNEDLEGAAEQLKDIKGKSKELTELRLSMTRPLDSSKKKIMEFFKRPLERLVGMERMIKSGVLSYQQEQECIRREQERKLQEQARKAEEKEKKRLEVRIQNAEAKGKMEKAEELKEKKADVFVPAPIVVSTVVKPKGISTKKVWKYRIIDVNAIPRKYMIPNDKMLGELARGARGVVDIPGVQFYPEDSLSARS